MRRWIFTGLIGCFALTACSKTKRDLTQDPKVKGFISESASPSHPSQAILSEKSGTGRVAYLGYDVDPDRPVRPGDVVTISHYFKTLDPILGDYQVFVHGDAPGGERLISADHAPIGGQAPTSLWKKGQVFKDVHKIRIPDSKVGDRIVLFVGLFANKTRLTVQAPPGASDGQDRIKAGALLWEGGVKDDLPELVIPRTSATITADGKLDEAAWKDAVTVGFTDTMGRPGQPKYETKLRMLYDDTNLYVSFESKDEDVSCPYKKRDDPIYEHESVEVFLMPNVKAPELGPYLELQASPSGVIFDAAFTGRRRGMDVSFNAGQTVGTTIDGTLNEPGDTDRGWISEWAVPWKGLRGVTEAPKPGDEWRMNAFRIENKGEYTAWSPPRVGDFHNVERFGRLRFGS